MANGFALQRTAPGVTLAAARRPAAFTHGYLHFYSDDRESDATSMLYMRQFPRAKGGFVIFTHMPKPFADADSTPAANQTYFSSVAKVSGLTLLPRFFPLALTFGIILGRAEKITGSTLSH